MTRPALDAFAATAREVGCLCAICQTSIDGGAAVGRCPACEAPFHTECWAENGGCATYGCAHMPETVKAEEATAVQTHWGEEEKDCPRCAVRIKVAALRCRHCGTVFESSAPVSRAEFMARERQAPLVTAGRTAAVVVFVMGLLPVTAPLCLLLGGGWALSNRAVIARLPGAHRVLCYVGLGAAAVSTALLLLAAAMVGTTS